MSNANHESTKVRNHEKKPKGALDLHDDLIGQLIEHNPRFHALLRKRLKEKTIPASKAGKLI